MCHFWLYKHHCTAVAFQTTTSFGMEYCTIFYLCWQTSRKGSGIWHKLEKLFGALGVWHRESNDMTNWLRDLGMSLHLTTMTMSMTLTCYRTLIKMDMNLLNLMPSMLRFCTVPNLSQLIEFNSSDSDLNLPHLMVQIGSVCIKRIEDLRLVDVVVRICLFLSIAISRSQNM